MLVLCAGAGSLVCAALAERASWLERLVTRVAVGAVALPLAQIVLYELARVRHRPALAIALGLAGLPFLLRDLRRAPPGREPSAHRLLLVLLALSAFWTTFKGALAFPSFEGRDGWGHALGARYLLEVGVPRQPFADWPLVHYVDAYPPLFDALLSLAAALGGSINAPLKAVSALLAGLVLPAFFFFALRVLRSPRAAALATALWAVLPANLTRHVWAHSLALVLTFVALGAAARLRQSRRFLVPGVIALAGVLLAAPTAGLKALLLVALAALAAWRASAAWAMRVGALGALAVAVSAIWYAPAAARYGAGLKDAMQAPAARRSALALAAAAIGPRPTSPAPAAGERAAPARRYSADDFLFFRPYSFFGLATAPKFTEEIAPIGLGLVVALAAALFLFTPRAGPGALLVRLALVAALALALGPRWGLDFYAWRAWMLLAPLGCLAAAAFWTRPPRAARGAGVVLLAAVAGLNALAAAWFDYSGDVPSRSYWSHGAAPGPESPWFFLAGAPLFAVLAGSALALALAALPRRRWRTAAAVAVVAHVLIAAPIRLRALTRFVQPLGYGSDAEYRGYLALLDRTERGDRVLPLSGGSHAAFVIGLDRRCAPWDPEEHALLGAMRRPDGALGEGELLRRLRARGYAYVAVDPSYRQQLRDAGASEADIDARLARLRAEPGVETVLTVQDGGPDGFHLLRIR